MNTMFLAIIDEAIKSGQYWGMIAILGLLCMIYGIYDIMHEEFSKKTIQKIVGGLLVIGVSLALRQFGI